MSKVGYNPITIEPGVTVKVENNQVVVNGPKGELKTPMPAHINMNQEGNTITFTRENEEIPTKAMHGTVRAIVNGMVEGVSKGFSKKLEVVGVGYRVRMEGTALVMNLGLNHPVKIEPLDGIIISTPDEATIIVSGIDKQKVGEFAAYVREIKKPEPYKGKGIRYEGEYVRRKSAKSATGKK